MRRPERRNLIILALSLSLGACQFYYDKVPSPDDLMHIVPWFDAMINSPAVYPYEFADIPRYTVAGTVPITGGEKDYEAEWRQAKTITADALVNPTDRTATAIGDTLFHTFCATCHGNVGAGDGLVGRKLFAPSLLTEKARGYSDGYIYSMIRYGRGVMPRYGDKIVNPQRRWEVVNYLRSLQAQAPTATVPAAAAPATGGAKR
jgi:mono/diheme cytochrome c family protein